ncbi:MAG TPA: Sec-independent protein translocase subunit TatB [Sulfurovum sp.]|nr:Sec-independent protein translocase subunit TatB [Sulfurovum sp.]
MFGIGFVEILFIAIIAIIFLGPDKLPEAMVQVAKFMNSFRKTVSEAKSSFENEVHMKDIREQANTYRDTIAGVTNDIAGFKNSISNPVDDLNRALQDLDDDSDIKDNFSAQATKNIENKSPKSKAKPASAKNSDSKKPVKKKPVSKKPAAKKKKQTKPKEDS